MTFLLTNSRFGQFAGVGNDARFAWENSRLKVTMETSTNVLIIFIIFDEEQTTKHDKHVCYVQHYINI